MTITIRKLHLAIAVLAIAVLAPATTAVAFHVFDDVPDDRFYSDAVEWAFDNDITTGTSATTFEPDTGVTRGQNVTFAKRYDDNIVQPALTTHTADIAALTARVAALEDNKAFVVTSIDLGQIGITDTRAAVTSVALTAPAAGTVVVHGSGTGVEVTAGEDIRCTVSTTPTPADSNTTDVIWEASGATTGSTIGEGDFGVLAQDRAFSITSGTTQTYYFACVNTVTGGNSEVWAPKLTAMFIPD
jgi:hypothetical protein